MRLCLLLSALLPAAIARAEFQASTCKGVDSRYFSQIFLEENVSCETAEKVQQELTEIQAFMGDERPPLILFIPYQSYESFGTFGGILVLNHRQMAWGKARPQSQKEIIWAHELGHAFFSHWLAHDFKALEGFRGYMSASARIQAEKKDPFLNTDAAMASLWRPEMGMARDIQVPYNELFADLVAVLRADDKMAMTKAMLAPGMPEKARAETGFYGFAGRYNLAHWAQTDVHYFFAPARAYIGEHFLRFPMSPARKKALIKAVYQACLHEIEKHWSLAKALPSPEEANRSLILALSRAVSKR